MRPLVVTPVTASNDGIQTMKKWLVLLGLIGLWGTMLTQPLSAHGTEIALGEVNAIAINARFDNGDPMSNAQISIYAPNDPASPWLHGEADANGHFVFVPDTAIPGQWDIQVRTAGHGDWVYVDIAEGTVTELRSSSGGLTTMQIVLMSGAVIWGLVGTALYFSRGPAKDTASVKEQDPALV